MSEVPLGPPLGARDRPTVGSYLWGVSYERGTPVQVVDAGGGPPVDLPGVFVALLLTEAVGLCLMEGCLWRGVCGRRAVCGGDGGVLLTEGCLWHCC